MNLHQFTNEIMQKVRAAWGDRLVQILSRVRLINANHPNQELGAAFAEGYRAGYWDGVSDVVHAAAPEPMVPVIEA